MLLSTTPGPFVRRSALRLAQLLRFLFALGREIFFTFEPHSPRLRPLDRRFTDYPTKDRTVFPNSNPTTDPTKVPTAFPSANPHQKTKTHRRVASQPPTPKPPVPRDALAWCVGSLAGEPGGAHASFFQTTTWGRSHAASVRSSTRRSPAFLTCSRKKNKKPWHRFLLLHTCTTHRHRRPVYTPPPPPRLHTATAAPSTPPPRLPRRTGWLTRSCFSVVTVAASQIPASAPTSSAPSPATCRWTPRHTPAGASTA